MPTTIHIPDDLLRKLDERARALNIPRNRYIVEGLRKVLADQTSWSPAFLEKLEFLSPIEGVDELLEAVQTRRTRKAPLRF